VQLPFPPAWAAHLLHHQSINNTTIPKEVAMAEVTKEKGGIIIVNQIELKGMKIATFSNFHAHVFNVDFLLVLIF